jgi:hypothetical protein
MARLRLLIANHGAAEVAVGALRTPSGKRAYAA